MDDKSAVTITYQLLVGHLEHFYDWRDKTLTRLGASFAGTLLVAGWVWETRNLDHAIGMTSIVLLVGLLPVAAFVAMEQRNNRVIKTCREQIAACEAVLFGDGNESATRKWFDAVYPDTSDGPATLAEAVKNPRYRVAVLGVHAGAGTALVVLAVVVHFVDRA